ncbi:hypothetical protein IEC_00723 [Bacillus toyonensis]|nr:hypothetical protein IEC_00723 [Bacillus toyonensis]EOP27600.1 hypothetical protein IIS_00734 [Bacillus cereus VD131]MCS3595819.1 hypothetical protein [Bacillus sp. JUb91]MDF9887432.1 hypothetical protein [Bacillus sp. LEw-kw-24]MDH6557730.1 hypothetical protein [Bacillus sp. LEw-kw-2]MDH8704671.1 hypothetical protein [Stenotrophomonas sp. 1198]MDP9744935.1 hypothetical protein [Bacillus thuringiensis]
MDILKKVEKIIIRILIIQFICLCVVQLLFIHKSSIKYLSKIVYYEGVVAKNKEEILQVSR